MSPPYLEEVNSHDTEDTISEPSSDGTIDAPQGESNYDSNNNVLDHEYESTNGSEPGASHLDKKAKVVHTPSSPVQSSSENDEPDNSSGSSSSKSEGSICSEDFEAAEHLQSSQRRVSSKWFSAYLAYSSDSILDYEASEHGSQSPQEPENPYSRYRMSSSDLTSLHMFTGKMAENAPHYVPVYKRNKTGKLLKLTEIRRGHWQYVEVKTLEEEEIDGGLKIMEEPKAEVVSQSSGPKKAGARRTLADVGMPETNPKGGWGWL